MKKLLLTTSLAVIGLHGMQAPASSTSATYVSLQQQLANAAIRSSVEDIKKFIAAGANINAIGKYNTTILHFACFGKREANIQYVLSIINHSLINQIDKTSRQTALDYAIYCKCKQSIIDLLRSKGAQKFVELQTTAQAATVMPSAAIPYMQSLSTTTTTCTQPTTLSMAEAVLPQPTVTHSILLLQQQLQEVTVYVKENFRSLEHKIQRICLDIEQLRKHMFKQQIDALPQAIFVASPPYTDRVATLEGLSDDVSQADSDGKQPEMQRAASPHTLAHQLLPFQCTHCYARFFSNQRSLTHHYNICKNGIPSSPVIVTPTLFSCNWCNKGHFDNVESLQYHRGNNCPSRHTDNKRTYGEMAFSTDNTTSDSVAKVQATDENQPYLELENNQQRTNVLTTPIFDETNLVFLDNANTADNATSYDLIEQLEQLPH